MNRIIIEKIRPELDHGRHPVKRILNEALDVETVLIADGHDHITGQLLFRHESEKDFKKIELKSVGNDTFQASFPLKKLGTYFYAIEASLDSLIRSEERRVRVEPLEARYGAWYEFFPRSFGTLRDAEAQLDYAAKLGFDIVYLPPIHPIGLSKRKGKNNALTAGPTDVGSPWAIGSAEGGHKAVHPDLGSLSDFKHFVAHAKKLGIKIALDIAFQCSPDHPYLKEHPEWFKKRADGTIQCAENPPKRYEDIYPFDFFCKDREKLWEELKSVVLFWVDQGVDIFRVDNPHTKPFPFWEWLIDGVKAKHPQTVFLSEAFTRPHIMKYLAKIGFSQSYTYFTWRRSKKELQDYAEEMISPELSDYFRPNFWPNTPDILSIPLRMGLRTDFEIRLILAATLSSSYGIYGPAFELCEHQPRDDHSEEYLHSEKYELKHWILDAPVSIAPLIQKINHLRRKHVAFTSMKRLRFHPNPNPSILAYSNVDDYGEILLTVVNLDPNQTQTTLLEFSIAEFGGSDDREFVAHDLLNGPSYTWKGTSHYVELNPTKTCAHIFRIERQS